MLQSTSARQRGAQSACPTHAANGRFEGYASLFGREDKGRDIIMPGAFRASLKRRGASEVRMLFQHDPAQPIGIWERLAEDSRGLHVRGRLIGEVARAREVLALLRSGAIDGLSIGFNTRKAVRDARTGQRRIYEIDLWEISIVTFPMLPSAKVSAVEYAAV
ncbi:MAG: HK97 family phage prohead protease [Hyphomicrobiales bacterium]|nr:HK97 family phage prohead protease [Hyphomicrobiales bacterium]